jgi:TonB dependent receptor.
MYGHNFGGGRGNITLQGEYNHDQRVFGSDIPWYRQADGFVVSDVDAGLLPNQHNSDGFPDRIFVQDIRSSTISAFGLVPISQQQSVAPCGTGLAGTNGGPSTISGITGVANGTAFNCTYIFNPDGSLVAETGTRAGTGPSPTLIGGNGPTTREGQQFSVFPENKRINLNLLAHYSISDAFEPFVEAKWVRIDSTGNNSGPSFIQGAQFDFRERPRLDNPFLDPTARNVIASQILASGCNPATSGTCNTAVDTTTNSGAGGPGQGTGGRLSAADIAMVNAGTYRFLDLRRLADFGLRDEVFKRDTYRVVAGIRGTFNTDWSYELSANYGQFDQNTTAKGYVDRQRFVLAMDAGRNPATGQIQCRSQFDPTAAVPYFVPATDPRKPIFAARLAADIAACVPYNPFGGADNSASVAYFGATGFKTARETQLDFLGFVNGDSSQLFSLPGGPIGFVLGGEYRRETAFYHEDPLVDTPGGGLSITNEVDVGNFDPHPFHVAEAFGEINMPILKDVPFFHELSVSGAGRYSRYAAPIKGVWTYNFGGEWAPVRDIRFRANFGKSVRAPNLSETGFPVVPNFSPTYVDPCSSNALNQGSTTRAAACQADVGTLIPTIRNGAYSLGVLNGSNPNLVPEVSHSLTVGGVLQPRFLPNFSLSVDYYRITVDKVIAAVTAQTIVNNCYDLPAGNPFCALFTRWRGPGSGPNSENPGEVLFNTVLQGPQNYAKRVRRGIDISANYRARLASKVVLDTGLIWVHGLQNSNFENVLDPNFENQNLGELGDPKDEGRLDVDLKVGNVTFGYNMHYIGWQYINNAEDQISLLTACNTPGNLDTCPPNNADFATPLKFPAITYHGLRVQWDTGPAFGRVKNLQIYAGVDNVFDRHPPLGLTGTGSGPGSVGLSSIYDVFGRRFFGGVKVRM